MISRLQSKYLKPAFIVTIIFFFAMVLLTIWLRSIDLYARPMINYRLTGYLYGACLVYSVIVFTRAVLVKPERIYLVVMGVLYLAIAIMIPMLDDMMRYGRL